MRLAVISDMHGNQVALDAVLEDIETVSPDQIICLGDAIQGGPQPAEVVESLRQRKIPTIMGNADAWLLTGNWTNDEGKSSEVQAQMEEIRQWSLSKLSAADREFIAAFAPTLELELEEGKRLLGFHGTHRDFDELMFPWDPEETFTSILGDLPHDYMCGGHTHVQFIRHLGRRFFFNPGSVGFAYRHGQDDGNFKADPWAEYAVLTCGGDNVSLEFRRVPFDVARYLEIASGSGRPYAEKWVAQYSD